MPRTKTREPRPEIVKENEDDGDAPAVNHAGDQAIDKAPESEQLEFREDAGQQGMTLEFGEENPQADAQYVDHLK